MNPQSKFERKVTRTPVQGKKMNNQKAKGEFIYSPAISCFYHQKVLFAKLVRHCHSQSLWIVIGPLHKVAAESLCSDWLCLCHDSNRTVWAKSADCVLTRPGPVGAEWGHGTAGVAGPNCCRLPPHMWEEIQVNHLPQGPTGLRNAWWEKRNS